MPIGAIFATSLKNIFSLNSGLPWKCASDMNFFRSVTLNTNIVMGRKTMESIRNPLPKRNNYVMTRTDKPLLEGFLPITKEECISRSDAETFWVIGGTGVISEFMGYYNIVVENKIGDKYCFPISDTDEPQKFDVNPWLTSWDKKTFNTENEAVSCNIYTPPYKRIRKNLDNDYLEIGASILEKKPRMTRNGLVRSSFDPITISASFDDGFPILKSKRVWWKGVYEEFKFFLSGETDTSVLSQKGVKIWEGNTSEEFLAQNGKTHLSPGEMGPMYGFQWRHFGEKYLGKGYYYGGLDQIENVINLIIKDPSSRRILMTTYNPSQAEEGVLYPCHGLVTQFYVEKNKISLKTYQRSADWVLGVPFNISSYALLLDYITREVNKRQSQLIYLSDRVITIFGDAHIYEDHVISFLEQYIYNILNTDKIDGSSSVILKEDVLENYEPVRVVNAKMVA